MKKFYKLIVNHTKIIICFFATITVICAFCSRLISVNYDMNSYLPSDSASTMALNVMNKEFSGDIPNARIMVKDVTISQALSYKKQLQNIDGILEVLWLDDSVNINMPLGFMSSDALDTYYKNNNALFSVTIEEDKNISAVDSIREIIGEDNCMSGSAVSTAIAATSTTNEVSRIAIFGILFALIVLLLTTTSFAEPFIVLLGLGIAVIINAGSNLIFGEISFVTNAAGNILQLAVSLDYSVFLIHRYKEYLTNEKDNKTAMVSALCASTSSIFSSGLTTVIGFLALCLMRFRIGPDLGLALAKGISISLLCVFIFMPAFILATTNLINKTSHRPFLPSFKRFGKLVSKVMIPLIFVFVISIIPSFILSNANSFYYGSSHIFGGNTKLGSDTDEIAKEFGKSDTYVLIIPKGDINRQKHLSDEIKKNPQVKNIISFVDMLGTNIPEDFLEMDSLSQLYSEQYTRMIISCSVEYEGSETFELVKKIRHAARQYYPEEWYLAGQGVSTYDLKTIVTSDLVKINLLAVLAVFVVLLFTLKSIWLPIILVLCIETAIWINLSIPYISNQSVFYIAYLIISSIQLGATVDYAILFTDRYREMRSQYDKKAAIINTVSTTFVSIITSASVLIVVGFIMGIISTHGLLSQLGYFLGRGTLCSLLIVMFVLPGLLYVFDKLFIKQESLP